MSNEVVPDSPVTVSEVSASSADPPSGRIEMVLCSLPGAWWRTPSSSPSVSSRRSSDSVWRSSTGVTSNVDSTARWSEVQRLVLAVDVRPTDLTDELAGSA